MKESKELYINAREVFNELFSDWFIEEYDNFELIWIWLLRITIKLYYQILYNIQAVISYNYNMNMCNNCSV